MTDPAPSYDLTPLTAEQRESLARDLNNEERRVLLNQGTEPPFCGGLLENKAAGTYCCRLCGLPLFDSNSKFESGTGWPSFAAPRASAGVEAKRAWLPGVGGSELRCGRCGGHLGHAFEDGVKFPGTRAAQTGKRFCINGAALVFVPSDDSAACAAASRATGTR